MGRTTSPVIPLRLEIVAINVLVSEDTDQHVEWLREYADLGFDTHYLHNVHRDQARFIDVFGESVLPHFAKTKHK
ncbi:hypothetical protein BH23BAC4_BH23BAC4_04660 [soil metagenome]